MLKILTFFGMLNVIYTILTTIIYDYIVESQKVICVKENQSKSKSNYWCNKNRKENGQARSTYLLIYFLQAAPISFQKMYFITS